MRNSEGKTIGYKVRDIRRGKLPLSGMDAWIGVCKIKGKTITVASMDRYAPASWFSIAP